MVSDISDLEYPVLSKISLDRQAPRLRRRHDVVTWHSQDKQELRRKHSRAATGAGVVWKLGGIATRERIQYARARNKVWIDRARYRQSIGIDSILLAIGRCGSREERG